MVRKLLTQNIPKPPDRFDWSGVTVGHWKALRAAGQDKHGARLYECVSRCGVHLSLQAAVLAAGGSLTCEACRAGAVAPRPGRVADEATAAALAASWGSDMPVEFQSNQVGDGQADWERYGRPLLEDFLGATSLGSAFGWKAKVLQSARRSKSGGRPDVVRWQADYPHERRAHLSIIPARAEFKFIVSVTTGIRGEWSLISKAIKDRCAAFAGPADDEPAPPTPSANGAHAAPAAPAASAGAIVERLKKLSRNVDVLTQHMEDASAAVDLRAAAAANLEKAEEAAAKPGAAHAAAETMLREAIEEKVALTDQARALRTKLDTTEAALAKVTDRVALLEHEATVAAEAYAPKKAKVDECRAAVRDIDLQIEERRAAIEKAKDLAPLLAALEKWS